MKRFRAPVAFGVGLLILAGCEYPTEAPKIEQRWILPVETTTIDVDELLPSGVTVSGSNFAVTVDPVTVVNNLGELCSSCAAVNGQTAPKPAFDDTVRVNETLPADVVAASLASASIQVSIQNGFGFDPIRPGAAVTGEVVIRIRNGPGGAILGEVTLDGATESLPSGSTVTKTIELVSADIGSTLATTVAVNSPAGDPVRIDTSESLTVTATPTDLLISSASVNVTNQTVTIDPENVDMEDIDEGITDKIQQGSVILDVVNPFGITVTGTLNIGPTSKTLNIPASATSTVTLAYTGDELRSFLGQPGIQFSGSGTVSASGPITVSPGQVVTLEASVDLTILIDSE